MGQSLAGPTTFSLVTLSMMGSFATLTITDTVLMAFSTIAHYVMLSVASRLLKCYAECHYVECRYADRRGTL